MGEPHPSARPSRRVKKLRETSRAPAVLHLESLEQRRLLHGATYDELPELDVFELPSDLPEQPLQEADSATHPLTSIPVLNSLPGAAVSVFLDFDSNFVSQWGGYSSVSTPVFDEDGDPTTFSDEELTTIENVWAQVSEDYAPFNVNVTTVEPSSFANGDAIRVSIGGDGAWTGGTYGGVAYVNSFTNYLPNTVFVFGDNLYNYYKYIAEASSHEAGHAFGLEHQSQYNASGQKITDYYAGSGGRAPIMGDSYSATRGMWWYGTSTSATTYQDDLAVISRPANGFGYRADDHGNTASTATPLAGSGGSFSGSGILTTTGDVDYFSFDAGAGPATLSVAVPAGINNLDTRLELRTDTGQPISSAAPSNSFNATISTTLSAGSYTLVVLSEGNYGDVGQYTVTADVSPVQSLPAVVGRMTFYNQSGFEGDNAGINSTDDFAIAFDKVAYLPGTGSSGPQNVTSYSRGINGIMIDLAGDHGSLSLGDFTFRMSGKGPATNNSPGTWTPAPTPTGFSVRPDAGTSGSDRVEFVWAEGTIVDRWLQVVVEGNDAAGGFNTNTHLAASDIFFFGNKIGDTFTYGQAGGYVVDSTDQILTRNNQGQPASKTNIFDFNRDLIVDLTDEIVARNNQGYLLAINIANPPESEGDSDAGGQSAVSLALAAPRAAAPPASDALIAARPARAEALPPRWPQAVRPPAQADDARHQALNQAIDELPGLLFVDDELLERLALRT